MHWNAISSRSTGTRNDGARRATHSPGRSSGAHVRTAVAYPIEAVWSAIADPGERAQWFGDTSIDAQEGGMIDMVATGPPLPAEKKRMTGRILVWDPPHVLEHEWKQAIVEDSVVRYEL
jgi:uncharacterized protein YndB with AHSA1/START domain